MASELYKGLLRGLKEVAEYEHKTDLVKSIDKSLNDALKEDLEEPSKIIDNDTSDHGMLGLINSLIISEYDAIDQYNSAIATAESVGQLDAVPIFKDIIAEEHVHVGQLQAAAKLFDQSAKEVAVGVEEAQDQLEQGEIDQAKLDNEIIESL